MTTPLPTYLSTLQHIPKLPFLFGPSPIQPLPRLTRAICPTSTSTTTSDPTPAITIHAKREDCNSPLAYGGNKVRKLAYLVADAQARACTTLVSVGGIQSNHTRAVTAVAAAAGMQAITVQEWWVPIDPPLYAETGNILLSRLMGGDVRVGAAEEGGGGEGGEGEGGFGIGHKEATRRVCREVEEKGGKPYYIPAGASDHELGGLGFVECMVEIGEQERELGMFFDTVIVCSVTGSSHAGLIVGAVAEGKGRKVVGIDASGKPEETKEQVTRIARNTAKLLDLNLEIPDSAIILDDRFHEGIYGVPGASTIKAMQLAARTDAIITDPVYEGKSMAGMIQLIREGTIRSGSNVLYIHLGGQPALNAYSSYFETESVKDV
ncbi:MAG: hypothetical protein Q9165_006998 [Trypethelium subeluteriae]